MPPGRKPTRTQAGQREELTQPVLELQSPGMCLSFDRLLHGSRCWNALVTVSLAGSDCLPYGLNHNQAELQLAARSPPKDLLRVAGC